MTSTRDRVRHAGMRVTRPRVAILDWLEEYPQSTADQVGAGAWATLGSLSTQAVYDVLAAFTDAGLVRRIEPPDIPPVSSAGPATTTTTWSAAGAAARRTSTAQLAPRPALAPGDSHAFSGHEAEVVFWGRCLECQTAHDRPHHEEVSP